MTQSESELIRQARLGEDRAWEVLMRRHEEPVFRLAYLILGDPDAAQDVAQETFLRAYRSLDSYDEQRPLRPWLMRIARNLSSNQRRTLGRYWSALNRLARQEHPAREPISGVEKHVMERQVAERLWRAIRRLRPQDQQVIYLRFFLTLSVEETAAALSVAPGTVKSRLYRALERLKQIIEHLDPDLAGVFDEG